MTEAGRQNVPLADTMALTGHQSKLVGDLKGSLKKGGGRHSPSGESWTDRLKRFFT